MPSTRTIMHTWMGLAAASIVAIGAAPAYAAWATGDDGASSAGSQEPAEEVLVTPSVLLECAGAMPGATIWAAIRLEIKPGWHTYWPGQNDTGAPTEIVVNSKSGVKAGPVLWPPPRRYESPGEILDHVHEGGVTALVPITLPPDATIGDTLDLSFELSWLVCQGVCIPGWETLHARVEVLGSTPQPIPATGGVFAAARARLPEPVSATERIASIQWEADTAVIRVRGAHKLAFYPGPAGPKVEKLLENGVSTSDTLRLPLKAPPGEAGPGPDGPAPGRSTPRKPALTLQGLLEVYSADGISRDYEVRSTAPGPG